MGRNKNQIFDDKTDGFFSVSDLGSQSHHEDYYYPGGLFASVGQMGIGFGVQQPNPPDSSQNGDDPKLPFNELYVKYIQSLWKFEPNGVKNVKGGGEEVVKVKNKNGGFKLKIKIRNPSIRRLCSGAIAGAISRTTVAPLETIRTHLMVGSSGHSTTEVFQDIMKTDGWKGLFRGNLVNVIRVAPSKAIEVFC
ncbi:protein brittle-1 [Trifolium pratense]|uniref:Protein brittle-1 n=1 Tax=Trifolium pratense TaxID=57577 RepID=A0A2K3LL42_TRIPR|nr:protein brittle-1 [Trifolium pratense]PNX79243.1 protein brittle-1 [Trifolium pratense]